MSDGFADLDAMIARVRELPELGRKAAPEIAEALEQEIEKTIAAGTDSLGNPWQAREDGGRPLATAAKALVVVPVGTRIVARLTGHIARHHLGRAKGGIYRPILPTSGLPPAFARRTRAILVDHFNAIVRGAK